MRWFERAQREIFSDFEVLDLIFYSEMRPHATNICVRVPVVYFPRDEAKKSCVLKKVMFEPKSRIWAAAGGRRKNSTWYVRKEC